MKREAEAKEQLCELQSTLNLLEIEEKIIDSLPKNKKIKSIDEVLSKIPHTIKQYQESH